MKEQRRFSVGNFALMSRTTRKALHYYDSIKLLSPVTRGRNKYRYYSIGQLAVVNVIHILQEPGMTLAEIKEWNARRTPEII